MLWLSTIGKTPTPDILLVFFFLVSGFFYGLLFGRARLLAFTIALYAGIAIASASTLFTDSLPENMRGVVHIGAFAGGSIISSMAIFSSLIKNRRLGTEGWWQVFILSFLSMGLAISYVVRALPFTYQQNFTEPIVRIFISDTAYVIWLVVPLIAILFASRKVE
jgi:MFS family permease